MAERVRGYCPMGCGETLFLASENYITCCSLECPNPTAAGDILDDQETEHIVVFADRGFDIQHPLRERIEGELFDCQLHAYCSALKGPPTAPGRYRVVQRGDWNWGFTPLRAVEDAGATGSAA